MDSIFDLPYQQLSRQSIWLSQRNGVYVDHTFDHTDFIVDLVVEGRSRHVEDVLIMQENAQHDHLLHLFDLPTKRLVYPSGITLDCCELPNELCVVIVQLRGLVDASSLQDLQFVSSSSKVAEAFLSSNLKPDNSRDNMYSFRHPPVLDTT
jgi:hypothetical protein